LNNLLTTRLSLPFGMILAMLIIMGPVSAASSPTAVIYGVSVTPSFAPLGARVTATVTIHNLDTTNPLSTTVSLTDGGILVATSKQPLTVPAGGIASTQLQFKTATGPAHCYLASTSSGNTYSTGYCEAGSLLGGTAVALSTLAVITPYLALGAAAVGVFAVMALSRRRKN